MGADAIQEDTIRPARGVEDCAKGIVDTSARMAARQGLMRRFMAALPDTSTAPARWVEGSEGLTKLPVTVGSRSEHDDAAEAS